MLIKQNVNNEVTKDSPISMCQRRYARYPTMLCEPSAFHDLRVLLLLAMVVAKKSNFTHNFESFLGSVTALSRIGYYYSDK